MSSTSGAVAHRRSALWSVGALLALVVGAPAALAAISTARFESANPLAGIPRPDAWSVRSMRDALADPVRDDTVIDLVLRMSLLAGWVALVVVVVSVILEVVHLVRHDGLPRPDVRGLGWSQHLARSIAGGLLAIAPLSTPPDSLPVLAHTALLADPSPLPAQPLADEPTAPAPAPEPIDELVHVVQRGESVYGIAEELAGGRRDRIIEIADAILDANLGREMVDGTRFTNPALIMPGWKLRLPADVEGVHVEESRSHELLPPGDRSADTSGGDDPGVISPTADALERRATSSIDVAPGDSLSGLAATHLGDEHRWTEIWELNRGRTMADGRHFDDPDLIVVGWTLRIPIDDERVEPSADPPIEDAPIARPDTSDAPIDEPPTNTHPNNTEPANNEHPNNDGETTMRAPPERVVTVDAHVDGRHAAERATPASTGPTTTTTSGPTTTAPAASDHPAGDIDRASPAPGSRSPIRYEHAAFLAGGLVALLGVRRRTRLRAAAPRTRVPPPRAENVATERRLRELAPGEGAARIDIALRSAAARLRDADAQIGFVIAERNGAIIVYLTAAADPVAPWTADGETSWALAADVPLEVLAESARGVGNPCLALVQIAVDSDGRDVLVDLEAAGTTVVEVSGEHATDVRSDDVVRAIALGLAASPVAESVHLISVSMDDDLLLDHPNAHRSDSVADALHLAEALVGSTSRNDRRTFELRARGTGGELWEPAVVVLLSGEIDRIDRPIPEPGHGLAIVAAAPPDRAPNDGVVVAVTEHGWSITGFGTTLAATPIGVSQAAANQVIDLVDSVEALDDTDPPGDNAPDADRNTDDDREADVASTMPPGLRPSAGHLPAVGSYRPPDHEIVVSMIGPIQIRPARRSDGGTDRVFQRAKAVELIAWLATHRERSTRGAARAALWETDVRDATFSNVVSDARRGLARMIEPVDDEWIARTLTDALPLHVRVLTDAELIDDRLAAARRVPASTAVGILTPAVEMIRGVPFEGTSYLWPDADGLTSNLVLLATTAAAELAGHALTNDDIDLVFWSTGQGLKVLPGHEELIGLRMQAHAQAGDLAGVRQEWASYERVIVADAWSDGEPAPKLLALRRELLTG